MWKYVRQLDRPTGANVGSHEHSAPATINADDRPPVGHRYGDIYIGGTNAKVILGDVYVANLDLFDTGTEEDRRDAIRTALYFEGMHIREQQISLAEISTASFQWVRDSKLADWLLTTDPFFWICGKPGSGKSTIMKHLIESHWTLDKLNSGAVSQWKLVHFYFDFRAGNTVANDPIGMLRQFVYQLSNDLDFRDKPALRQLIRHEATTHEYVRMFARLLSESTFSLCAFIDGLDEYDGDLWDLCHTLEQLQDQTGMRMCLASRPEIAFETFFKAHPGIKMQEHNRVSIRSYIEQKVDRGAWRIPHVHALFPDRLQKSIEQRAQGVILWAKLVVDEMLSACNESTTISDLELFLDSLPEELEQVYQRIFGKLNANFKGEAALVIHMLEQNGGTASRTLLYQSWNFIQARYLGHARANSVNQRAFDARIFALLGHVVDLVDVGKESSVRLIHKSLSAYLARSRWVDNHMPAAVFQHYGSQSFWKQLYFDVLSQVTVENGIWPSVLQEEVHKMFLKASTHPIMRPSVCDRKDQRPPFWCSDANTRMEHAMTAQWKPWRELLLQSLSEVPQCLELPLWNSEMRQQSGVNISNLLLLHCCFCYECERSAFSPWQSVRVKRLCDHNMMHYVIGIGHGKCKWLMEQQELDKLSAGLRSDIIDIILLSPKAHEAGARSVLHALLDSGTFLEGRHFCGLDENPNFGTLLAFETALTYPGTNISMNDHDPDCHLCGTEYTLAQHWWDGAPDHNWLRIFETAGISLTGRALPLTDLRNALFDVEDHDELIDDGPLFQSLDELNRMADISAKRATRATKSWISTSRRSKSIAENVF